MKALQIKESQTFVFKVLTTLMVICVLWMITIQRALAQTTYKSTTAELTVAGTSNVHDWEMKTQSATVTGQFAFNDGVLQELKSLDFELPVKNLKSKETIMDNRAYKTLKADQFNKFTYKLSSAQVTTVKKDQYTIKAEGRLTISGVTNTVSMTVKCNVQPDGSIQITGSRKMKMTDFKISPPSYMLGALKTGDDLNINFNLKLTK